MVGERFLCGAYWGFEVWYDEGAREVLRGVG